MKRTALLYTAVGIFMLLLCMCKKDQEPIKIETNTDTAYMHVWMEQASADINLIGIQASDNDTTGLLNTCAVITIQRADTANTDTMIVDYGTTACLCGDGKTRSGKIEFIYTGGKNYKDSAVAILCHLNNYMLDGSGISGDMQISNKGRNSSGYLAWSTYEALILTKVDNGGTITWNATKLVELLNTSTVFTGYANPITWTQAQTGVSGITTGVSDDGRMYTATIIDRLDRDMNCAPTASAPRKHPFIQGSIDFKPAERAVRTIQYGQGACDINASILLDGSTYHFGL